MPRQNRPKRNPTKGNPARSNPGKQSTSQQARPATGASARPVIGRGPKPALVALAQKLMLIRAGFGLLSVVLAVTLKSDLRDAIRKNNPSFDVSKLNATVNLSTVFAIVVGAVVLVLYIVLAIQVGKGNRLAWIITLILAGLGVLNALLSVGQAAPTVTKTLALVAALIDVAIVALLLQRRSKPYFAQA